MKIVVIGIGPVGLSLATSLALKCEVILLDIDKTKVGLINNILQQNNPLISLP